MNTLRRYQLRILPPAILVRKALHRLSAPLVHRWRSRNAFRRQPYSTVLDLPWDASHTIARHLTQLVLTNNATDERAAIAAHCLEDRLPVLGCGWIHPWHGVEVPGFEEYCYHYDGIRAGMIERGQWLCQLLPSCAVPRAQWLWNSIERLHHRPFDWQRDFRSGYRWSEASWHQTIALDEVAGADPKVPWELGRLQLLPLLAMEAAGTHDVPYQTRLIEQIETLLLDFAAQNPPGFGIQWRSSMDVAIRLANILVTLDLAADRGMRRSTIEAMTLYAYDHARFVAANLEWSEGMRANHYLACVAGLAVAASYFPDCRWTQALRRWCAQQLIRETFYQFLPDGGNFEASLAYHRLSAEMLAWAYWYLSRFDQTRAMLESTPGMRQRLEHILQFTLETTWSTFVAPQIGDNDSGRFLWLIPTCESWIPPHRWYGIERPYCAQRSHEETYRVLEAAVNADSLPVTREHREQPARSPCFVAPDFGVAVVRAGPAEVLLRAGSIGQYGKGGHAHNDQLSITLALDGSEVLVDPGTYVYLPSPALRNRFRSTQMHNTLAVEGMEQNDWASGRGEALFWLTSNRADARILVAEPTDLVAEHRAYGVPCRRRVQLSEHRLLVQDWCPARLAHVAFHFHPSVELRHEREAIVAVHTHWVLHCFWQDAAIDVGQTLYSHSYGICCSTPVLRFRPQGTALVIEFRWERRS